MGRIRSIKPEFPQSESVGRVSREARLLFLQLFTLVDDFGRTRASSRVLRSLLYPFDDDAGDLIDGWMAELERERMVVRYVHEGTTYLEICKWLKHQKISHSSPSKLPSPPENSGELQSPPVVLRPDLGSRIIGSRKRKSTTNSSSTTTARPEDVTERTWEAWLALRRAKRAPVSELVLDGVRSEAKKAGWTMEQALTECATRGWMGFKADWVAKKQGTFDAVDYTAGLGKQNADGSFDL